MNSLSIIVPVFNRQALLLSTLESLISQTVLPNEIILVDNGSTDNSSQICIDFAQNHNSDVLKVIVAQEFKKGANSARNKGATLATSDYLFFFDSDDILLPFAVEELKKCVREKSNIDLVVFPISLRKPTGELVLRNRCFKESVKNQILRAVVSTQSMIIHRSFFLLTEGWNENLFRWQDWEFGIRLFLLAPHTYFLKGRSLVIVYEHLDSITGATFSNSHVQLHKAISEAEMDIISSSCINKRHLLNLLDYKKIHLAGLFSLEGKGDLAFVWLHSTINSVDMSFYRQFLYRIIFIYVKLGGRASWILAKYII